MNVLLEIEQERIERAISVARVLGGILSLAVWPFLPSVGLGFVLIFGAMQPIRAAGYPGPHTP